MKLFPKRHAGIMRLIQLNSARSQAGQMSIEMMLIAIIMTAVAMGVSKYMRSNDIAATLVEGPWKPLQGMIEDGVWMKAGSTAHAVNPGIRAKRHSTADGDKI